MWKKLFTLRQENRKFFDRFLKEFRQIHEIVPVYFLCENLPIEKIGGRSDGTTFYESKLF